MRHSIKIHRNKHKRYNVSYFEKTYTCGRILKYFKVI